MGALWTGLGPNVARNAIINAAELASYDQVKQVVFPVVDISSLLDASISPFSFDSFDYLVSYLRRPY